MTPSLNIIHYMLDLRDAKTFYVYPPAAAGAEVEMAYMPLQPAVDIPGFGASLASIDDSIDLHEQYENPIVDFVLSMAFDKDGETAADPNRAAGHRAAFNNAIAGDLKASISTQSRPQSRSERADA